MMNIEESFVIFFFLGGGGGGGLFSHFGSFFVVGYNQLHAMLSLWANWLQLNSQLNSPGVSFWLYRM